MDKTELFSSCKTVGMYYLTLPSINTHFNTSKKKALGKHRGKKVKLLKMSNFTFFSHCLLCNLYLKIATIQLSSAASLNLGQSQTAV